MFSFLCCLLCLFGSSASDSVSTASSYPIEYSLDQSTYKKLSGLSIKFSQTISLLHDGPIMDHSDKLALQDASRENRLYSLRLKVSDQHYLQASIFACQLVASNMRLKLIISVNEYGDPISIHISTPNYGCHDLNLSSSIIDLSDLSVTFEVQKPVTGSSPETTNYLKRLEKQREEMARAEQGDNRSFLAKYWTYIVPAIFILLLFSNMQDPNAAGGGSANAGSGRS